MRLVITGATSMIGIALIKECIKNNTEVLAIVRNNPKRLKRLPNSNLVKVIYGNLDTLDELEVDGKYDVFYHLAWGPNIKEARDDCFAQKDNIKYTLNAIKLANKLGCHKFIGAGSQAEYGPTNGLINEEMECRPVNAYGICKLSASLLARHLCEQLNMSFIWGRIFSVYGTNDNDGTMLRYAIDKLINKEVASFSSGKQYWNYLYEDDAGKIFYLLGNKEVENGIYNIASNVSKPLKEYINECASMFDNAKCEFALKDNSNVYGLNVDANKTFKAIDYIPQVEFKDGIRKMIESIIDK